MNDRNSMLFKMLCPISTTSNNTTKIKQTQQKQKQIGQLIAPSRSTSKKHNHTYKVDEESTTTTSNKTYIYPKTQMLSYEVLKYAIHTITIPAAQITKKKQKTNKLHLLAYILLPTKSVSNNKTKQNKTKQKKQK